MQFVDLGLMEPLLRSIAEQGYETATPIQAQTIPHTLAGRDVLGAAQTGTGKTAAFALPVLHRLFSDKLRGPRNIRCLVLCPTRELALQIAESFDTYGKHTPVRTAVIFGGVGQNPQVKALRGGVDVCVATPGRLLDLMNQGHVDLRRVETLILDEADRMLDMGFIHDMRRIIEHVPPVRQTLLFSATMPQAIRDLSAKLLCEPVTIEVAPASCTADRVEQSVCRVAKANKTALLVHYLETQPMFRTIAFTRTKHGADKVVRQLQRAGIASAAIHGNKSQNNRQAALERFRQGHIGVLVATDVAARGIDIDEITHVVNYDVPVDPESYVHRIGRTARAGEAGVAITFCDREERSRLTDIEKLIRMKLEVRQDLPEFTPGSAPGSDPAPGNSASGHAPRNNAGGNAPRSGSHPRKNNKPAHANKPHHPSGKSQNNNDSGANNGQPRRRRRRSRRRGAGVVRD